MRFSWIALLPLAACAGLPDDGAVEQSLTHDPPLAQRRAEWEAMAPTCLGRPSKDGCDDGDTTLFNGLLCASGDTRGCDAVQASQGPDGRFWRSPRRTPGNAGLSNSFSRDMTLGVLLYLATTHDTGAAQRWLGWIDRNRPCAVQVPFSNRCMIRGLYRVCTDDDDGRCTIVPGLWSQMGRVWTALGLPLHAEMQRWDGTDNDLEKLMTNFTSPGFELHLKAVSIYLRERIGISRTWRLDNAETLVDKQPLNPFFRYLHDGATDEVASRVLAVCPQAGSTAARTQWSWERADDGEAWRTSMIWDCIFMDHLLRP